ncbi:ROK family protein [Paenibacillus sp. HW567]|uniref:ROK family protein n=1 Tax=Paenibacillus sp. HW567 TaxID=1034769 RepID=UPI00048F3944|nr:ROK family protein [Paenibacillus sp. HW567]
MSPVTYSTLQIKQMNIGLVKQALKTQESGTKAELAGQTSLSIATCNTILNELVATGEVIELGPNESSGGRPAKKYKYNADFGCAVCLLVKTSGDLYSIECSIVNLVGDIVKAETLEDLKHVDMDVIDQLIGRLAGESNHVMALGIGIPGVVSGGVIGVCDVPDLVGKALGPYLEEKYEMPVTVENDMNMTVYGFYHLQHFEEEKTFAVVTFPENQFPGAGFIVDGRILSGNTKFGGEVSFLPFGMTREEQLRQLHTAEGFVRLAVQVLTSIIAVINPVTIAITGELPQQAQLDDFHEGCRKNIPEEHMPLLFVQNDTNREYMKGVVMTTLEILNSPAQWIEQRQ